MTTKLFCIETPWLRSFSLVEANDTQARPARLARLAAPSTAFEPLATFDVRHLDRARRRAAASASARTISRLERGLAWALIASVFCR